MPDIEQGEMMEGREELDSYMPTPAEVKCVDMVIRDFDKSRIALKQSMHDKWNDALNHYFSQPQIARPRGQANIAAPIAPEYVDTLVATSLDMLLPGEEVSIGVRGFEGADKQIAKTMTDLISYQIQQQRGRLIFRELFFNAFCFGTAPCKVIYEEEFQDVPVRREIRIPGIDYSFGTFIEKVHQLRYKGGKIVPIDPFDFYPDPNMKHIKDGSYVCHTFYPTIEHLEKMEKKGLYRNIQYVKNVKDNAFKDEDNSKRDRRKLVGVDLQGKPSENGIECIEWQGLYENDEGEKTPHIIVVAPGNILIRKEEMTFIDEPNNYEVLILFPTSGEFWGQGIPMKHDMILHAIDALWNVALDAMYQNVNSPLLVSRGGQVKDRELINRAGQIIHVNTQDGQSVGNYIQRLVGTPVLSDVYQFQAKLEQYGQNVSAGMNDITSGSLPSVRQTATAIQQSTTHASIRHKDAMRMLEDSGIIPIVRKLHKINRQFLDQVYVTAVIGQQGMFWNDAIAPQQIAMDTDFICYASSREMDRAMNIQQLEHFLQIVMGNPEMMPLAIPIAMKIAEEMKLPNYDDIEQQLNWIMQQKQMFDMQLQQSQLAYAQMTGRMPQGNPGMPQGQGMPGGQLPSTLNTQQLIGQIQPQNQVNVGGYMPAA